MKDNSGNTIDPSGQLITFNRNDPSNNIFSSYNLFGNDENRDNDLLHEWRQQTILKLLKMLEEDENDVGQKRSRSIL